MCLSPSEETLIALTDHQQIYQLSFSGVDITKVRFDSLKKKENSNFRFLGRRDVRLSDGRLSSRSSDRRRYVREKTVDRHVRRRSLGPDLELRDRHDGSVQRVSRRSLFSVVASVGFVYFGWFLG